MKIDIITYKDELEQDLKSMLGDYLKLVAKEVKHDPWRRWGLCSYPIRQHSANTLISLIAVVLSS